MKPRTILETEARLLVESGAVRAVSALRTGERWAVVFTVGLSEMILASKREDVRQLAKLDTVSDWLQDIQDSTKPAETRRAIQCCGTGIFRPLPHRGV
jgi:hypothetical protein